MEGKLDCHLRVAVGRHGPHRSVEPVRKRVEAPDRGSKNRADMTRGGGFRERESRLRLGMSVWSLPKNFEINRSHVSPPAPAARRGRRRSKLRQLRRAGPRTSKAPYNCKKHHARPACGTNNPTVPTVAKAKATADLVMDSSPYTALSPSSDGINPLRPYYKPPSIGLPPDLQQTPNTTGAPGLRASLGTSARDIFSEINYGELLGDGASPSAGASLKLLLDKALWKYSSVFMAQPFEVAKTILQCHDASARTGQRLPAPRHLSRGRSGSRQPDRYERQTQYTIAEEDGSDAAGSSDDSPTYFTSAAPTQPSTSHSRSRHRHDIHHRHHRTSGSASSASRSTSDSLGRASSSRRGAPPRTRPTPSYRLELRKADSLSEVLSQTWQREGAWGLWKGTNVTFVYGVLLRTLTTWTRSMLAALLALPDAGLVLGSGGGGAIGGRDLVDSPAPFAAMGVAVVASAAVALLLAPLDIARTRYVPSLSPPNQPPS